MTDLTDRKNMETWLPLVYALSALKAARQTAYAQGKIVPELQPYFMEAQALYERLCADMGVTPEPVFDLEEHRRQRIAEGHPDFVAVYGNYQT